MASTEKDFTSQIYQKYKLLLDTVFEFPRKVFTVKSSSLSPEKKYFQDNSEIIKVSAAFFCATGCSYILNQGIADSFVRLSYPLPDYPGFYGNGPLDLFLAFQFASIILFLRAFACNHIFYPLSERLKIKKHKLRVRFCDQSWQFLYGLVSFFCGCYILLSNPDYVGFDVFWRTYPIIKLNIHAKLFYVVQIGFWASQMFTLFIEEKRKDFSIMLAHHIVTEFLVLYGYYIHAIYIGILVHATMDAVDIFLPLSKLLKYAGYNKAVNFSFLAMLVTWLFTRHYLLCRIIYNTYVESPLQTEMIYDPASGRYWTNTARIIASVFLSALEILCIIWLYQISIVIRNIFKGKGTSDIRSDDEDSSHKSSKKSD
ncbi:Sphingosine N-acyltransferase lag1 [Smittium mucronatum]|uniref:Sphingosine N-acyltransferase lag1 n=1 Tax=Smittium mucronatum TaxID=133383 RepID=A0A1R0H0N0_9FUNG|nr:Sphingosine N-acyltransferase lag1 [Smittium mucronatum]